MRAALSRRRLQPSMRRWLRLRLRPRPSLWHHQRSNLAKWLSNLPFCIDFKLMHPSTTPPTCSSVPVSSAAPDHGPGYGCCTDGAHLQWNFRSIVFCGCVWVPEPACNYFARARRYASARDVNRIRVNRKRSSCQFLFWYSILDSILCEQCVWIPSSLNRDSSIHGETCNIQSIKVLFRHMPHFVSSKIYRYKM